MATAKKTARKVSVFTAAELKIVTALRPVFQAAAKGAEHTIAARDLAIEFNDVKEGKKTRKGKYRVLLSKFGITQHHIEAAAKGFQATYKARHGIEISSQSTTSAPSKDGKVQMVVLLMAEVTGVTPELMGKAGDANDRKALTQRAKKALYRMLPKKAPKADTRKLAEVLIDIGRDIWTRIDKMPESPKDPAFLKLVADIWKGLEDAQTSADEAAEAEEAEDESEE